MTFHNEKKKKIKTNISLFSGPQCITFKIQAKFILLVIV